MLNNLFVVFSRRSIIDTNNQDFDAEVLTKRYAMDCIGRIIYSMDFEACEKPEGNTVSYCS